MSLYSYEGYGAAGGNNKRDLIFMPEELREKREDTMPEGMIDGNFGHNGQSRSPSSSVPSYKMII